MALDKGFNTSTLLKKWSWQLRLLGVLQWSAKWASSLLTILIYFFFVLHTFNFLLLKWNYKETNFLFKPYTKY